MGRRKIDIEYINDSRVRQVTLCKRRVGLFKKASDLSKLCGVEVAVVIVTDNNKTNEFSTTDVDRVLGRYKDLKAGGHAENFTEEAKLWEQLEAQRRQLEGVARELAAEKKKNEELSQGMAGARPVTSATKAGSSEASPAFVPPPNSSPPGTVYAEDGVAARMRPEGFASDDTAEVSDSLSEDREPEPKRHKGPVQPMKMGHVPPPVTVDLMTPTSLFAVAAAEAAEAGINLLSPADSEHKGNINTPNAMGLDDLITPRSLFEAAAEVALLSP